MTAQNRTRWGNRAARGLARLEPVLGRLVHEVKRRAAPPPETELGVSTFVDRLAPEWRCLPTTPRPAGDPRVLLLLPTMNRELFFGGVATALRAAGFLAEGLGRSLHIAQTLFVGDVTAGEQVTSLVSLPIPASRVTVSENHPGGPPLPFDPDDLVVTSAWFDAHAAQRLPRSGPFVYLVQDFEPCFYPSGDLYAAAEATYVESDCLTVCNTREVHDYLRSRGYPRLTSSSTWFEPAVGRPLVAAARRDRGARSRRLLFLYGRRSVPRNHFHLAISAVERAFATGLLETGAWDLVMAGEEGLPDVALRGGEVIQNLGKLGASGYERLLHDVDLALSPMGAPHPNYPTLEFASVGAAVVTTVWETKRSLQHYSPSILCVEPRVDALAAALGQCASWSRDELASRWAQGTIAGDWAAALRPMATHVGQHLEMTRR